MKHLLQNIVMVSALLSLYWGVEGTFTTKGIITDVSNHIRLDLQFDLPAYPHANPIREENSSERSESESSEKDFENEFHSSPTVNCLVSNKNIIFRNRVFQNLQFILSRKSIYLFNCAFRL
jgi:hypothetical protein